MASKEELQTMANALMSADVAMVKTAEDAISTFNASIDAALDAYPSDPAPNTEAYKFLTRLRAALQSQATYDLNYVKTQYGLTNPE